MSAASPESEGLPRIHRLANGVRVVCDPMPGLQTLALSVVVGRGARSETEAQNGWAHLLEHMVFKGAGQRSARSIVEEIEAEGGQINAATGHERTSFQVRALKGGLPLAMDVISDLVHRPVIDAGDLEREKQVVSQEIAEAADTPDDHVFELAQAQAFSGHALGRPILGLDATVGAASRDALAAFHAGLYGPDAIVVSAAGAVEEAELLDLVDRHFAADARAEPPAASGPARFVGGAAPVTRALEQSHLVLLLPAPGLTDPDYFALRLFAEILGGGMSSRLFQAVREERGLAYAIDAYADTHSDTGVLGIYVGAAAKDAAEAAKICAAEIGGLIGRVEPAELARAKAQLKAATFMARESALARAEQAAGQVLTFGRLFSVEETAQAIDAVEAADLARLGERLLGPRACAGAVLGPRPAMKAARAFEVELFG
ncbi:M16 family metallopeptidase [Phenylobacterium montanum]|uniref:Insulinase family protein n=1 Tax=Phenylobacterium montanum TaxID=2823693 RepID=A0A975IU18_9CAUL|nr:pitrilysin family protein [Caulobacter sp. S6]QUD87300.1 insulinase family protein [Caulobacter sp. S6]